MKILENKEKINYDDDYIEKTVHDALHQLDRHQLLQLLNMLIDRRLKNEKKNT